MKVVQVNYSDITGGAAKAAFRLHVFLKSNGLQSSLVVFDKKSRDSDVLLIDSMLIRFICRLNFIMERLLLKFYFKKKVLRLALHKLMH